jgi:MYXO-CTERM domain-containing protein
VCLAALVLYSLRFGSPLGVLLTLVLIACVELGVRFATAAAQTCGTSGTATGLEWSGAAVLLVGIGGFGAHRRRVMPLLAAVVAAGAWVALVAHVVPGGAGECFN